MDPLELLRFLLDPDRLAVVGTLARAPMDVDELVAVTGQRRDEVLRTLATLVQAGLVERPTGPSSGARGGRGARSDGRYALEVEAWRQVARSLPQDPPASRRVAFGMTADEAQVLGRFFRGDRLVDLPAQRSKRLLVLERLALEFEPGRRYAEPEVDRLLRRFHDDHATLRRELVDEGLLDRAAGEYWRSGGRIPL